MLIDSDLSSHLPGFLVRQRQGLGWSRRLTDNKIQCISRAERMERLIHRRPILPIQGRLEEALSKHTGWRLADMHRVTCQSLQPLHLRQGGFYLAES